MKIQLWNDMFFLLILTWAAWQDWKKRSISCNGLWLAGTFGIVFSLLSKRNYWDICMSCMVGITILGLARWTCGAIGEGDGWFFTVTGLYLQWKENIFLFIMGLMLCFLISLPIAVESIVRKKKGINALPFLTFLLPGGIFLLVR